MTKLTDRRVDYLVRQAQTGFPTDSLGQMAARWGITRRRLNQVLQLARATGGAPLLKTCQRRRRIGQFRRRRIGHFFISHRGHSSVVRDTGFSFIFDSIG
ncbi:MAG: hypothetical protein ACREBT_06280, partial [Thermoplasmata archaeon]